jgi:hypothetical protein
MFRSVIWALGMFLLKYCFHSFHLPITAAHTTPNRFLTSPIAHSHHQPPPPPPTTTTTVYHQLPRKKPKQRVLDVLFGL